jgi:hypothetical protein
MFLNRAMRPPHCRKLFESPDGPTILVIRSVHVDKNMDNRAIDCVSGTGRSTNSVARRRLDRIATVAVARVRRTMQVLQQPRLVLHDSNDVGISDGLHFILR